MKLLNLTTVLNSLQIHVYMYMGIISVHYLWHYKCKIIQYAYLFKILMYLLKMCLISTKCTVVVWYP